MVAGFPFLARSQVREDRKIVARHAPRAVAVPPATLAANGSAKQFPRSLRHHPEAGYRKCLLRYRRGLNTTIASGGRVTSIEPGGRGFRAAWLGCRRRCPGRCRRRTSSRC